MAVDIVSAGCECILPAIPRTLRGQRTLRGTEHWQCAECLQLWALVLPANLRTAEPRWVRRGRNMATAYAKAELARLVAQEHEDRALDELERLVRRRTAARQWVRTERVFRALTRRQRRAAGLPRWVVWSGRPVVIRSEDRPPRGCASWFGVRGAGWFPEPREAREMGTVREWATDVGKAVGCVLGGILVVGLVGTALVPNEPATGSHEPPTQRQVCRDILPLETYADCLAILAYTADRMGR